MQRRVNVSTGGGWLGSSRRLAPQNPADSELRPGVVRKEPRGGEDADPSHPMTARDRRPSISRIVSRAADSTSGTIDPRRLARASWHATAGCGRRRARTSGGSSRPPGSRSASARSFRQGFRRGASESTDSLARAGPLRRERGIPRIGRPRYAILRDLGEHASSVLRLGHRKPREGVPDTAHSAHGTVSPRKDQAFVAASSLRAEESKHEAPRQRQLRPKGRLRLARMRPIGENLRACGSAFGQRR